MSPRTRQIAVFSYIAVLVVGFLIYESFSIQIRAAFAATGASTGWATSMSHVIGVTTLFAAVAVSVFFSVPPGPLLYLAFGYWYGPYEGLIIATLATTVGSVGAFCFFRTTIPASETRQKIDVGNVFLTLLLLRSSPWIPNPLITVFCSSFGVGIVTFTLATFFGTMPLIAIYTLAASRLRDHLDVSVLYSPEIGLAFGLLSVVSLLGLFRPLGIVLDYLKAIQAENARNAVQPWSVVPGQRQVGNQVVGVPDREPDRVVVDPS